MASSKQIIIKCWKTIFMIFKSKNKNVQHKITVNIADQNIKQVDHTKSFAVYLEEKLCWKFRINHMFQ